MNEITSSDDVIDTRSARDRLEELMPYKVTSEIAKSPYDYIHEFATEQEARDAIEEAEGGPGGLVVDLWEDELREQKSLLDLKSRIDKEAWDDDTELISDDHFPVFSRNYHEGLAEIPDCLEAHIDWNGVAADFQGDYTPITWEGATFWYKY